MISRNTKIIIICLLLLAVFSPVAESVARGRTYKIRLASVVPPESHWQKMLQDWAALIEEQSEQRFRVVAIDSPVPGGELEIVSQVKKWAIECALVNTGALASWVPQLQVFEIPYFWQSSQEVYYTIDHVLNDYFSAKLNKSRFELIAWSENGWLNFFSQTGPVANPTDLIGMNVYSRESEIRMEFWRLLKAKVLPLPITKVVENFERGDVNAGENTAAFLVASGWTPYIKHFTTSRHIYEPSLLFCNKRFFDHLPEELRQVLKKSAQFIEDRSRSRFREAESAAEQKLREQGITIYELTPEQKQAFARQLAPVRVKYTEIVGRELVDKINQAKAALSQGVPK
jgi:TRAP-type transport system periplasmic protein